MLSYIVSGGNNGSFNESDQQAYEALTSEAYSDNTPLSITNDQITSQPTNGIANDDVKLNGNGMPYSVPNMNNMDSITSPISYENSEEFTMNGHSSYLPCQQLLEDQSPAVSEPLSVSSDLLTPGSDDKSIIKSSSLSKPTLKRVSFGSSKGSMVETLIYDSPVAEEERIPEEGAVVGGPTLDPVAQKLSLETPEAQKAASRVRVTFFECEKPLAVTSPDPPDIQCYTDPIFEFGMDSSSSVDNRPSDVHRQLSTDSGRDNPFRPDGDISKEADEIVQRIKAGQPLNGSVNNHSADNSLLSTSYPNESSEPHVQASSATNQKSRGVNGNSSSNSPGTGLDPSSSPGPVEVKHLTISPSESAQVEHVVLKKKNKRHCCVLQ